MGTIHILIMLDEWLTELCIVLLLLMLYTSYHGYRAEISYVSAPGNTEDAGRYIFYRFSPIEKPVTSIVWSLYI